MLKMSLTIWFKDGGIKMFLNPFHVNVIFSSSSSSQIFYCPFVISPYPSLLYSNPFPRHSLKGLSVKIDQFSYLEFYINGIIIVSTICLTYFAWLFWNSSVCDDISIVHFKANSYFSMGYNIIFLFTYLLVKIWLVLVIAVLVTAFWSAAMKICIPVFV